MAEDGFLLGVDIGTYESKGVITTLDGQVVSVAVAPHQMLIPRQGWAEHDAEATWWGDFVTVTRKLLAESKVPASQIKAVGCSAIGPDLLPVDAQGNPLRSGGILYGVDTRATAEIAEMNAKHGPERIFEVAGNALSSQSVGPKILWLKKNEPEAYQKAHKFLTATSFLVGRLTGKFVIDHLTAAFWHPLYDLKANTWSQEMCAGVVEIDRLPEIGWSDKVAGTVTAWAAEQTGLAEGTPVTVGAVDAASEALSAGVSAPGQMMLMYGSTVFIIEVLDHLAVDDRLWVSPYLFEGTTCLLAGMATSGSLTRWFRDKIAADLVAAEEAGGASAYGSITQEAAAVPPGAEGLVVLPYFSGERTPLNDPRARGVFFGLTLAHSRAHMFRATLEGIGYGIRHHFDIMRDIGAEPQEVIAVGGGTKSALWLQCVSDITQKAQKVPAVTLGASYGDAFLAGMGAGYFTHYTDINKWMKDAKIVEPNPANAELYDQYMSVYLSLYQSTKGLMHQLHELVN